jgi:hypothetical protein
VIEFSRVLNIASALLFIVAIFGVVFGLQLLVLAPLEGEAFGLTESQIRAFNSDLMDKITLIHRSEGLYMLSLSLAMCFISLVPFRRGEKWAWYLTLGIFGLALVGQAILTYMGTNVLADFYLPASILLVILWIAGLVLPIKEFFK